MVSRCNQALWTWYFKAKRRKIPKLFYVQGKVLQNRRKSSQDFCITLTYEQSSLLAPCIVGFFIKTRILQDEWTNLGSAGKNVSIPGFCRITYLTPVQYIQVSALELFYQFKELGKYEISKATSLFKVGVWIRQHRWFHR